MSGPLRVVVFNDSATMRAAIRVALERDPDMQVVAEQASGENAVAVVTRTRADAVIMDVVMPGVDGYQATREIMRQRPTPIVMVSSVLDARDARVVFAALEAGALHIAEPPPPPGSPGYVVRCAAFAELVRVVAGARLVRTTARAHAEPPPADALAPAPRPGAPAGSAGARVSPARPALIDAIGIVASAGGPQALGGVLRALPAGVMPPILLVQHLASGFTDSFAGWLRDSTGHAVVIAERGERSAAGVVYMPPEDHHIGLTPDLRLELSTAQPDRGFRPSGDHLLSSLASHGRRALGVVLSGMGRDGADGAARLRQAGGHVVAQDLASAAVTGMPSAVSQIGAADAMLPPEGIAAWLVSRSGVP
jgi:two-component system chemotaxis response regulator CheB